MSRNRAFAFVALLGLAAAALGLGLGWMSGGGRDGEPAAAPVAQPGATSLPGSGQAGTPISWMEHTSGAWLGITTTVEMSSDIFEATVTDISPPRFNTSTGGPPSGSNPVPDDGAGQAEWTILRYVTMEVTKRYKGDPAVGHAVMASGGGSYDVDGDGQAEYVYEQSGRDLADAAVGDRYFVFGVYPFAVPPFLAEGAFWEEHGLGLAMDATDRGQPTTFVEEYAAFKVAGDQAVSAWGGTHDVAWLRETTTALTSP
jgi:hypothetical protein